MGIKNRACFFGGCEAEKHDALPNARAHSMSVGEVLVTVMYRSAKTA